jgi:hypothetical protein
MTDAQLTEISTIAWVAGTSTLFILLAHWSDGGSWGIANAVARGLIGWTGRNGAIAGAWPSAVELPPIDESRSSRLAGTDPDSMAFAELVDLGSRRLS